MKNIKNKRRIKRKISIRKRVFGTSEKPRMTVFKSHKNIYVQLIDDTVGKTIVSASTNDKDVREKTQYGGNTKAAEIIGETIAKKATEKNITTVSFDRNGFRYQGRIRTLADAARKNGLKF
ncbi:MAG: 50S ribosomal protein L18 [Candidatus Muiribacterium halophilum]|mgnify:CR=1 FL=1|uniref:Large ribosomal subunit protein uL18 n=1 Tax=Muiribacterium halophilum TaxID=2053465 RepID=A0A2N5ZJI8_MUIH1|nr:MAG: 50S ribosomal protein L18 [Candidatus Muirbacterium halophilum]